MDSHLTGQTRKIEREHYLQFCTLKCHREVHKDTRPSSPIIDSLSSAPLVVTAEAMLSRFHCGCGVDIVCLELVLRRGDRKVHPVGLKVGYGLKEKGELILHK
jgi:hypothetical protein